MAAAGGRGGAGGDGVDRVSLFFFSWALSRLLCDVSLVSIMRTYFTTDFKSIVIIISLLRNSQKEMTTMMTRAADDATREGGGRTTTTSKKESGRWTTQGKRGGENNGGSTMRWQRAAIEIALWDRHSPKPASVEMPHQAHPWHTADARLVPAMMADKLRLPPHHSSSVNFRFSSNNLTLTSTMAPHTHAESCESLSFSTVLGSGGGGGLQTKSS